MKYDYIIRQEKKEDFYEVENLTREAFWNVYHPGCTEHYVLHCYRGKDDFIPELDLVMERNGEIIGHIMYVRSEIKADNGRVIPIITFGPVSILPKFQKQGYGSALLSYSIEKAKEMGAGAIAITGNDAFYGKFGFIAASKKDIHYFAEPRENEVPYFLIKELTPGFLDGISGTFKDPAGYFIDEKEAEKFDLNFPKKQKLKLSGQLADNHKDNG